MVARQVVAAGISPQRTLREHWTWDDQMMERLDEPTDDLSTMPTLVRLAVLVVLAAIWLGLFWAALALPLLLNRDGVPINPGRNISGGAALLWILTLPAAFYFSLSASMKVFNWVEGRWEKAAGSDDRSEIT